MHNYGVRFKIDPTDSLLLTGLGDVLTPLLGMRGMELREGSGQQGYFQVRIVHAPADGSSYDSSESLIGLTINDVRRQLPDFRPHNWLGEDQPTYAWSQDGWIYTPDGIKADNSDALKFRTGDMVGLMVDCVEMPTLRFYLNGELVHQLGLLREIYGHVLYPAFLLNFAQIHITSNPGLPL